jgi:DNA-binding XRE family transcriptional regulator
MARPDIPAVSLLIHQASAVLGLSQAGLGDLVHASRKTVGRWEAGRSTPIDSTLHDIARAVHPKDPVLASKIAIAGFATLTELGLAEPPGANPVKPAPAARLLGDALVCAAAEALDASPRAIRPALLAAFARAKELGFTVEEAMGALVGEKEGRQAAKAAKR